MQQYYAVRHFYLWGYETMDATQLEELEAICTSVVNPQEDVDNGVTLEEIDQAYAKIATPEAILDIIKQFRKSCEMVKLLTIAAGMTEEIALTRSYFDIDKYESICKKIDDLRDEICLSTFEWKD